MKNFEKLCEELTGEIKAAYEANVTIEEAEKLAGKFLYAQIQVSEELKVADLDARMRKSGLKAIKATLYIEEVKKTDKKPSDTMLENIVAMDKIVQSEQDAYDAAEVSRDSLERYYNIFHEAHVHFRGISRGRYE